MVKDETLKGVMNQVGYTDEDLEKVTPEMERNWLNSLAVEGKYQLVAEVANAKGCLAGLKQGDKYIVNSHMQLDSDNSTAPCICMGAMSRLMAKSEIMLDRIFAGSENIKGSLPGFKCMDPGLDLGGFGFAEFNVTIEEIK